mgnify:CR=1 FL=1
MTNILDTGVKNVRNVQTYSIGNGSINDLPSVTKAHRIHSGNIIFFIDEFFSKSTTLLQKLQLHESDVVIYVSTKDEPSTKYIDEVVSKIKVDNNNPSALVGIGGGITLDVTKAVSNLLTNGGNAADYQGWDLVRKKGIFKIAIPTLSGTGSEATRTCVMTNTDSGLKLGMNSDFTVFDQIIMDPEMTNTVPANQYFYTGMDAYIHCIEALNGSYRNAIGDSYSRQTIDLCREVFLSKNMMSDENRTKLMVASYLGGCAIGMSYVGIVHPFSAGLSVVLGLHHCVANCITMRAMEEFYPTEYKEFWKIVKNQGIDIPKGVCSNLTDDQLDRLYSSTIIHEKPLFNALGENFKNLLNKEKVIKLFKMM